MLSNISHVCVLERQRHRFCNKKYVCCIFLKIQPPLFTLNFRLKFIVIYTAFIYFLIIIAYLKTYKFFYTLKKWIKNMSGFYIRSRDIWYFRFFFACLFFVNYGSIFKTIHNFLFLVALSRFSLFAKAPFYRSTISLGK